MQIINTKYKDKTFNCFEDKSFYNSILDLSDNGFDKLEYNINTNFNVMIINVSNSTSSATFRVHNPNLLWKYCTTKMVKKRLNQINKFLNIKGE